MIKYFDDIVGKDLGWDVLGTLLFYFAVFMTPIAIPLAVLLSSLITFGNLGEHFELTAIKASGISLLRALLPIFGFVCLLTVFAFYSNNNFVPRAALEAYSLLYDIKQKKPSMDLKEGAFYSGIPDYSIKVEEKLGDGQTIKDVIIYDHTSKTGNKEVTIAESGKMYTILNDRYLKLELNNGNTYIEGADDMTAGAAGKAKQEFTKSSFEKSQIVLDLSSFQLGRTDKSLFTTNRIMRNISELNYDIDSMTTEIKMARIKNHRMMKGAFTYLPEVNDIELTEDLDNFEREFRLKRARLDSLPIEKGNEISKRKPEAAKAETQETEDTSSEFSKKPGSTPKVTYSLENRARLLKDTIPDNLKPEDLTPQAYLTYQSVKDSALSEEAVKYALNRTRQIKGWVGGNSSRLKNAIVAQNVYEIQWHKILSNSFACIIMFLIGAPLGAIIKRGGLGVPVLVSILFFIIFYVLNMTGEKYAKQDLLEPWLGLWSANIVLLPIGLFFLRQARIDARLFDSDFYNVIIDRFNRWVLRKRKKSKTALAEA